MPRAAVRTEGASTVVEFAASLPDLGEVFVYATCCPSVHASDNSPADDGDVEIDLVFADGENIMDCLGDDDLEALRLEALDALHSSEEGSWARA